MTAAIRFFRRVLGIDPGAASEPRRLRRPWAVLLLALMLVLSVGASAHPVDDVDRSFEEGARDLIQEIDAPGAVVVEVDSNGIRNRAAMGVTESGRPIDGNSVFVWGSVSKSFTALVTARLEQEGALSPTQPIGTYLPELSGAPLGDVTVTDLVQHTSGLPHDLDLTDRWGRPGPARATMPEVATEPLEQRGTFRYSSLNYLVLTAVIESATGHRFSDALSTYVLRPLGLDNVISDASVFEARVEAGHVPFFGRSMPVDTGVDGAGLGYGYLAGSADELAHYVSWQLQNHAQASPDVHLEATSSGSRYGQGWYHDTVQSGQRSVEVIRHAGAVPGYFTYAAFIPSLDRGYVVLANKYGEMESSTYGQAAQDFVLATVGTTTGEKSPALYPWIVGAQLIVTLGLLLLVARVAWGFAFAPWSALTAKACAVRVIVTAVIGSSLLILGLWGLPHLIDVPLEVAEKWAPDVIVLLWVIMAEIFLATALIVFYEVSRLQRFSDLWNDPDAHGTPVTPIEKGGTQ